ncbi:MAG: tRNA (N(6)-L-threonylcarbamoyladenosine(37)-C(2))-methylthiotransferase MtaB [Armatimonadota bacterium]
MARPPRVALGTLGCKLNQYESAQMREDFEALGFVTVPFDADAEVYVLNTCTVTHRTDRDTRRLARQARRRRPDALVIITGCGAQMQREQIEALGVADLVLANEGKPELAQLAAGLMNVPASPPAMDRDHGERLVHSFPGNTRAFVKVQEGCNAACTYCIIRQARGPSRSVPTDLVVRQAARLGCSGHPEVVLVGTHLGAYGQDLGPDAPDLAQLVEMLCDLETVSRVRLSSIEPREVTRRLIELTCAGGQALRPDAALPGRGKVCRHLHIPLQSGCDATLQRMGRPYDAAFYYELVEGITARAPQVCIGADVLAGFPGETEAEFTQTMELLRALPVAYLHAFSYSERPGTPAAQMPGSVEPEARKRRTHALRALSAQKAASFAARAIGQCLEVVVETPRDKAGRLVGVSDNYLRVAFDGPHDLVGRLVAVQVTSAEATGLLGSLAE